MSEFEKISETFNSEELPSSEQPESAEVQNLETSAKVNIPVHQSTAEKLGKLQKNISISQFMEANRQMLGFSTPSRNLFITVKEIVDNALDAADDAKLLPTLFVKITRIKSKRYLVNIRDYGPGILKDKVPKVFGSLLYGSKFDRNEQRRGQQGLGVSAAVLSSQIDTAEPTLVISKCLNEPAYSQQIKINILKNQPIISNLKKVEVDFDSGVDITMHVKGAYIKEGKRSIKYYLELISIINPYAKITLVEPDGVTTKFERSQNEIPRDTSVSKIHPHTVELGTFSRLVTSSSLTIYDFLLTELHSSNQTIVAHILQTTALPGQQLCASLIQIQITELFEVLQTLNFLVPEQSLAAIGTDRIMTALKADEYQFAVSETGETKLFKNTIAKIELVLIYDSTKFLKEGKVDITRAVNKTPLLLQQSACLITKSVEAINWKNYGLSQNKGELPHGPAKLFVHLAGLKIGFTSEAKEAIAENLALGNYIRGCLKKLGLKLAKKLKKKEYFTKQKEKAEFIFRHLPTFYELVQNSQVVPVEDPVVNQPIVYSKILNAGLYYEVSDCCYRIINYSGAPIFVKYLSKDTQAHDVLKVLNETVIDLQGAAFLRSESLLYSLPDSVNPIIDLTKYAEVMSTTSSLYEIDSTVEEKIKLVYQDVIKQLQTGTLATLKIRIRNKNNLFITPEGWYKLGDKKSVRSIYKIAGLNAFYQLLRVLKFIYVQLIRNKSSSLREVYYHSEQWGVYKFQNQKVSDTCIEHIEVFLGVGRQSLNIYPELRGQIAGAITYEEKTKRGSKLVDCLLDIPHSGGGITLPYKIADLEVKQCSAKLLLAIETTGTFNRVLENNFHTKYNVLLASLVGQPVRAMKEFIQKINLHVGREIPIIVFLDCDPWSLLIFASVKFGAAKTAHLAHKFVTPRALRIGLTFQDVLEYGLPTDKLSGEDVAAFERLLIDPRFTDPLWAQEINLQLEKKAKCEQQSLAAKDIDFVTEVYLPRKLQQFGFL